MNVTEIFPKERNIFVESENDAISLYPPLKGFRWNYVISANCEETNSHLLTSDVDRFFLRVIRSVSDLIVCTGLTAREEQLKASKQAPMLLLTRQSHLACPITESLSEQVVYVTTPNVKYGNANTLALNPTEGDLAKWLQDFCREYAFSRIVVESGVSAGAALVEAGLIDEICLTVSNATGILLARELAEKFLKDVGAKGSAIQVLKHETTFLFRFAMHQ